MDWPDALACVRSLQASQSSVVRAMIDVMNRYNADYSIPLASQEYDSPRPSLTPTLLADAIDQPAMRAASLNPMIFSPILDPTRTTGKRSIEYARKRRIALDATYARSGWKLGKRRFYRHIQGYGRAAIVVIPDETHEDDPFARVCLRNPLTSYAEPKAPEDLSAPRYAGFVTQHSAAALHKLYPNARSEEGGILPKVGSPGWSTDLWDVLEWIDADVVMIGLMGPSKRPVAASDQARYAGGQLLRSWTNRADAVPVVVPQVITLDKITSRLAQIVGRVDLLDYLVDLDMLATEKSVVPDRFAVARPGESPAIVSNGGQWMEGRTGEMNLLDGIATIGELRGTPDPNNKRTIAELERGIRMSTGLVSPYSGETMGALRTGRGIDAMMSVAVDPRIQEIHEIAEEALRATNDAIFAVIEGYWPKRKFTVFSGSDSNLTLEDYTPAEHFETRHTVVKFPIAGTDQYGVTVELGQMVQAEMISRRTARRMHPHVGTDADEEENAITIERLDAALMRSIEMRATQGGIPPEDAARIRALLSEGLRLDEAVTQANTEAQQRQSAQTPAPMPGEVAAAAQPGLANPGEGAERPPVEQAGAQQMDPAALIAALTSPAGAPA